MASKIAGIPVAELAVVKGCLKNPGLPDRVQFIEDCPPHPAGPPSSKLGPQLEKNQPKD